MAEIFNNKALEFAREKLEKMAKKFFPGQSNIILAFYFSEKGRPLEFKEIALKFGLNRMAVQEIISRFRDKVRNSGDRQERILRVFEAYRAFYYKDYLETLRLNRRREKNQTNSPP